MNEPKRYPKRGFGSMDPQRVKEICSMGGKVAHRKGTAHTFTSEQAKEAGRKGGLVRQARWREKQAKLATS